MSLKDLSDSLDEKPAGFEIDLKIKDIVQYKMMTVQFPDKFVDDINKHVDENIIPKDEDYSYNLIGQINRNEKSKQLTFPLDDEFGNIFRTNINGIASNLIQNPDGYNKQMDVECFEAWTVHSYEGDYNPLHDHGTKSPMGLSCIFYMKVPEQISNLGNPDEEFEGLNNFYV